MNWIKKSQFKGRIKVIDHREIFRDHLEFLPTFNSRSIASLLWKVPNLSEKFIYLNDDYLLTSPVKPSDFFLKDKVVLRGDWHLSRIKAVSDRLKTLRSKKSIKPGHLLSQRVSARTSGFINRYFLVRHNPHPYLKSTWKNFAETKSVAFTKQISYSFRSPKQFNPDGLSAHWNLKLGRAARDKTIETLIISPEKQSLEKIEQIFRKIENKAQRYFLCIQSLDNTTEIKRHLIYSRINNIIGSLDDHTLTECKSSHSNNESSFI
jgi:hypothetical protein